MTKSPLAVYLVNESDLSWSETAKRKVAWLMMIKTISTCTETFDILFRCLISSMESIKKTDEGYQPKETLKCNTVQSNQQVAFTFSLTNVENLPSLLISTK